MFRYLIVEDEPAAQRRLLKQIQELRPDWKLTGTADSVKSGVVLVQENDFDLIFCDIELSDGDCFEMFRQTGLNKPVIFITAYDDYAVKAFDFNSIHYLLKPIRIDRLQNAIDKFEGSNTHLDHVQQLLNGTSRDQLNHRILSKIGNKTRIINTYDVACFYYANSISKCILKDAQEYYMDKSLNEIMDFLPEYSFFRINRQVIVAKESIVSYSSVSSNRLKLKTEVPSPFPFIVSKERASGFRKWLRE